MPSEVKGVDHLEALVRWKRLLSAIVCTDKPNANAHDS